MILLPRQIVPVVLDEARIPVLQRLGEMSHVGLVYPRVDDLGETSGTDYRAGGQHGSAPDLSAWAERLAGQPADTNAAFWLAAGHLGQGQIDRADDVLRRALNQTPTARDLRHLAAIVAYRRNDLDAARSALDTLLQMRPDDQLAAFNLAVIDDESGHGADARAAFERAAGADNPALQRRAADAA